MLIEDQATMLRCGNQLLDLSKPVVMGIINATPDSFYPASRTDFNILQAVDMARNMISEGAKILDIGGMSSRPGSEPIPEKEEIDRVLPVIEAIHEALPGVILSVDTYRTQVARLCIRAGAGIINDISGGELDNHLWKVIAEEPVAYILMHMRGTPADMQSNTQYQSLMTDLATYFVNKIRAMDKLGIREIIIDPGFGFAKNAEQNLEIVRRLRTLSFLNKPVMIGLSRKSTLSKIINRSVEETLHATTAMHMVALMQGARILRTHDVQAASDVIQVYHQLNTSKTV